MFFWIKREGAIWNGWELRPRACEVCIGCVPCDKRPEFLIGGASRPAPLFSSAKPPHGPRRSLPATVAAAVMPVGDNPPPTILVVPTVPPKMFRRETLN